MNIENPGRLSRRKMLVGAACALPLATVLQDPRLARAAADSLETVFTETPSGHEVSSALALPEAMSAPAVILIHEWWGLNDQIKAVAAEFAKQGYMALAIDLFGGKVATTSDEASAQTNALDPAVATETMVSWVDWAQTHERSTGEVGTVGWCFGGSWSLNTALATPTDACVVYYGRVNKTAQELDNLACPVLGHFGTLDTYITKEMVDGFIAAAKQADKEIEVYWYEANHGFANPTSARYDAEDTELAWQRTLAFLGKQLGLV